MAASPVAWVYVLRLRSDRLYIGATTDLRQRLSDHLAGIACRTTALDPPLRLVYVERHATFSSARLREGQVKRWTASKKEALVAHDAGKLRSLARCRTSPSSAGGS